MIHQIFNKISRYLPFGTLLKVRTNPFHRKMLNTCNYCLPRWRSGKESACQCRRHERHRFNPWVGKIPWSRKWHPAPVFLSRKFHGQRSLVVYSPGVTKSWTQLSMHRQIIMYILRMAVPMSFSSHSKAATCIISKGISLAKDRFGSTLVPLSDKRVQHWGEKSKLSLDNTWRFLSECFSPYRGYNFPWCFIFK